MTEHQLQALCVTWFRFKYKSISTLLFSVPNGVYFGAGKSKAFAYMNKLKDEGLTNGVADLILLVPKGKHNCLCIEMKVGRNKQSKEQVEWQKSAEEQGALYIVCKSFTHFVDVVNNYLSL